MKQAGVCTYDAEKRRGFAAGQQPCYRKKSLLTLLLAANLPGNTFHGVEKWNMYSKKSLLKCCVERERKFPLLPILKYPYQVWEASDYSDAVRLRLSSFLTIGYDSWAMES